MASGNGDTHGPSGETSAADHRVDRQLESSSSDGPRVEVVVSGNSNDEPGPEMAASGGQSDEPGPHVATSAAYLLRFREDLFRFTGGLFLEQFWPWHGDGSEASGGSAGGSRRAEVMARILDGAGSSIDILGSLVRGVCPEGIRAASVCKATVASILAAVVVLGICASLGCFWFVTLLLLRCARKGTPDSPATAMAAPVVSTPGTPESRVIAVTASAASMPAERASPTSPCEAEDQAQRKKKRRTKPKEMAGASAADAVKAGDAEPMFAQTKKKPKMPAMGNNKFGALGDS